MGDYGVAWLLNPYMSLQLADARNRLLYRTISHSISGDISLPFTDPTSHRENTVHLDT